ncbi:MAG TPA: M3 family oligoendopeptidase [Chloroflexota bacterium]|nr:M3 family oligoendopeptidase [Chloroflexota bacterium]
MSLAPESTGPAMTWDLSDLFAGPEDPRIAAALDQAVQDAQAFAGTYRGTIDVPGGPASAHLLAALKDFEKILENTYRVEGYAHLVFDSDTTRPIHRDLMQKVRLKETEIQTLLLFFELEWQKVEDVAAERLLAAAELAPYAYYLRRERQNRPHTLSEPEEKMAAELNVTGGSAWQTLFTELIGGLKFPLEQNGQIREATLDEVLSQVREPDRTVRQRAYETQYRVLRENDQVLSFVYNTLIQEKRTLDRLRHYPNPMASRHQANDIAPEIVETMLAAVEANAGLAQDYFRLKAKLLKLPRLAIYDQYAPFGDKSETVDYATAQRLILDAFGEFTPSFADMARRFFDERWIDAEVRPGKRGGAYCMGLSPNIHPFILCNYNNNLRDVMTVAHELGHGLHDLLAVNQTLLEYSPSLALAETASVFGEMLVFERLLEQETNPRAKVALLGGKIEDIFATVFRQTVLTRFEQFAFERQARERLTPQGLGEDWLNANRRYYGDAVEMDDNYRWGWSYIPHFIHTPFYCYAYSFGELLVLALYAMYKEQGRSFIPGYTRLLARGGSGSPAEVLGELGVNIAEPSFWNKGFDELRALVVRMEGLVEGAA